jgi:hypothetical protein
MRKRLEDLIGAAEDLTAEERDRLRRVHDLLLEVGPPPEVPEPLRVSGVRRLPTRRRPLTALLAAALAAAAFGAGYVAGTHDGGSDAIRTIPMTGIGAGRGASVSIELLPEDAAGNWPMDVHISGLEPNARGGGDWYELWLTQDGKPIASCGRFTVHGEKTTVRLSVPYRLRAYDGWIVTRRGSDEALLTT